MAFYGPAVFPSQPVTSTFAGSYPGTQAVPGGSEFSGDVITPTGNLYPGSGTFAGQGNLPLLDVYFSFSDVSVSTPVWTWIAPNKIREFHISRTEGETGTASLVLDNRNRYFDPTYVSSPYYPNVRPLNRVWLRAQFAGETNSMFKGYAESYDQQWPNGGWSDAIAVVTGSDEFKRLALATVPTTNPPRNSYQDVVSFDQPVVYWTMDESSDSRVQPPAVTISAPETTEAGQDAFELGELQQKAPTRKHAKKPVGRKAPPKKHKHLKPKALKRRRHG